MVNSILALDHEGLSAERMSEPVIHHPPHGFSDRFAWGFTKVLRFPVGDTATLVPSIRLPA